MLVGNAATAVRENGLIYFNFARGGRPSGSCTASASLSAANIHWKKTFRQKCHHHRTVSRGTRTHRPAGKILKGIPSRESEVRQSSPKSPAV